MSKSWGRLRKFLWPSQKSWTLFDLLSTWIWIFELMNFWMDILNLPTLKILSICCIILHSITLSPVLPRWTFLLIKVLIIKFSKNIISDQTVICTICIFGYAYSPPVLLHLIFEKSSLKNQVHPTWFFKLVFSKIKCRSIGG